MARTAGQPGWDGYGANPFSRDALGVAREFGDALPETFPAPQISADPDGEISFEWARGPHWVFTVSVAGHRQLSYAGLFGPSRAHGVESFAGTLPEAIMAGLARLFRSTAPGDD